TMLTCHVPIRPAATCTVPRTQLLAASRRHVAASYWTAASDVAPTSAPVNDGQRRRRPVNGGGSRWRTVASESTNQKPRSTIRKLYDHVSKTCSWWYPKLTPTGYKWKCKSLIGNVNTNVSMPLGNESRTADISEPMTSRCSTLSNTPLSSNSFATRRDNSIHRRLCVLKEHDMKSQASKFSWHRSVFHHSSRHIYSYSNLLNG
nr:hypothetical protein [Tanacetum cinerariifolium]